MKALFHTLGCKVNQYETQAMRALLAAEGYDTGEYTPGSQDAGDGIIVINSCTVTGESDRKLRQLLRRCRRENPSAVLVLTGCMPQAFPEMADTFSEADIVLGNAARSALPHYIHRYMTLGQRIVDIPEHSDRFEPLSIDEFQGRTRAFVKIEDGCNRFCSYCIIPYARGRVRSKPLVELQEELTALAGKGYGEVVLVGINLTAYGSEWGQSLCDAVETACAIPDIRRVRLGSLEPDFLTPDILKRLAVQEKLCPQFHVSLQSGCDTTLQRMNRRYTTAEYTSLCETLRRLFPACALTTDVMVGFPGENEAEFEASLNFVRQIGFAKVHVFAYSPRPGTPAARASEQVPGSVKTVRSRRMIEACEKTREAYMDSWIGRTAGVLVETNGASCLEGYTGTYLPVRLFETTAAAGDIVNVRLLRREDDWLIGERI